MAMGTPDSSFSSTIKKSFDYGTLCRCGHRRLDHRLLNEYTERDAVEDNEDVYKPDLLVSCVCPCSAFVKATNLEYLEFKVKDSEAGT